MARNIPDPNTAAQRWQSGFGAAGSRWTAGIEAVTTPPGQLAAAAQPRYLAGVQQNVGKWASRVAGTSLASWKQACTEIGAGRLGSGAQKGMAKYQARIADVLAAERSIIGALPPRGSVEQNIERSRQFQLQMYQAFQGK